MSDERNVQEVVRVDDKDWFLQSLVNIVNSGPLSFGITLNVGGFLVSGTLIGGKEYFEGFGEDFAKAFPGDEAVDEIKASFAKQGEIYSSDKEQHPPSYIHLQGAKFFTTTGNPVPGNQGILWRGRLSEIDGFSLGLLTSESS